MEMQPASVVMTRVLAFLPKTETHYEEYLSDYKLMSAAILACQRNDGFLGWVQGTGDDPSDNYPFGYNSIPNFEDFGAGCVLLAAAESWKLSRILEKEDSVASLNAKVSESIDSEVLKIGNKLIVKVRERTKVNIYRLNGSSMRAYIQEGFQQEETDMTEWKLGMYILQLQSNNLVRNVKIVR